MQTSLAENRRPAGLPEPTPERPDMRDRADRAKPPGQGGPDHEIAVAPRPAGGAAGRPRPPADVPVHQQLLPTETATTSAEPDEVLVTDPRASLAPSQFVDQRLLALMGSGSAGLYIQASGRPGDIRRLPGR